MHGFVLGRNGCHEVSLLSQRFKTSFLANTEVQEIIWLVWIFILREVDRLLVSRDGVIQIHQFAEVFETFLLASTEASKASPSGCPATVAFCVVAMALSRSVNPPRRSKRAC